MTFFFAGMDTTGTSAGLIFYALAKNPESYKKLMREVNSYEDLLFENLNGISYTNAVIKETLRIWPVVSTPVPRISNKEVFVGKF
jgi:cytochrome P450